MEQNTMDANIATLDYTSSDFGERYSRILNSLHYDVDTPTLKRELVEYARTIDRAAEAEKVPHTRISLEGKIAYCINHGAKLDANSSQRIVNFLDEELSRGDEPSVEWEYLPDTNAAKIVRAYVSCYSHIDNAKTRVLKGKLDSRQLSSEVRKIVNNRSAGKSAVVRQLFDHYKDALSEAKADSYIADWVKPLTNIVNTIGLMLGNKASIKAGAKGARARKMASTSAQVDRKGEKAAAKVTYKDEDIDLGIMSIDPTNIVGAEAVVIFNTKNKHCEIYRAKAGMKLSVQGAKIINFDESLSVGKTLRKPESDLPHWSRASNIRRLEVLAQSVNGKSWELTGKLNRNSMVIKVI